MLKQKQSLEDRILIAFYCGRLRGVWLDIRVVLLHAAPGFPLDIVSVERSLMSMKKRGLVVLDDSFWKLTDSGYERAKVVSVMWEMEG